ncbi:hypothetical protein HYH02_006929 [Chlamydomonas schloesseri]|uniref:Guanylate cyclase domain-containing protein n=1 Tax=Chlamydomonas schloesseri TaxID=2026947 RepID=A0A835WIU0_9CHLO|nr:hypothetical protein HYH02_006929 [Chlamydomonas schloesseri]|eukprot:KAG2448347.1 hypothetical protein HYH02_006929 [Chlamydomonas schloesseri]
MLPRFSATLFALLLCILCPNVIARFSFSIGTPSPGCSAAVENGLAQFTARAAAQPDLLALVTNSASYPVSYETRVVPARCSASELAAGVAALGVDNQFVVAGAGGEDAQLSQSLVAGGRPLFHPGVTSSRVFELGLSNVYGVATPPAQYAMPAVRAMLVRGGVSRLAVAYRIDGEPVLAAACAGVLAAAPALQQLRPGAAILPYNYSTADAQSPGFYTQLVARIFGGGGGGGSSGAAAAQALVACDGAAELGELSGALAEVQDLPAATYLLEGPTTDAALELFSQPAYVQSAAQWLPAASYADALFGSASKYASAYAAANGGKPPGEDAAGASAAALTVALALQTAFMNCNVSADVVQTGDVERLLSDPTALSCREGSGAGGAGPPPPPLLRNVTGYQLVARALREGRFDTFYGPVGFGGSGQNQAKQVVTTQVLDGAVQVVLPAEAATAQLVVPTPRPQDSKSTLSPGAVVGIVIGSLLFMPLVALIWLYRRQRRRNRNLFGQVRPPGVGPLTTLLLTDIESSTTLWESLPPSVMERAMELHDGIIRGLAAEHDGYEVGNEGDSFSICFHNSFEAVLFAVKAQQRLLLAAWPEALLRHEKAEAVWMTLVTDGAVLSNACQTSSWCSELLSVAHSKAITAHNVGGGVSGTLGSAAAGLQQRAASLQKSFVGAARSMRRRIGTGMASFTAGNLSRAHTSNSLEGLRVSNANTNVDSAAVSALGFTAVANASPSAAGHSTGGGNTDGGGAGAGGGGGGGAGAGEAAPARRPGLMTALSARLAVRATFEGFSSSVLSRSGHSGSAVLHGATGNGRAGVAAPGQIGSPIDVAGGPDGRISPSAAAAIAALVTGTTTGSGRADSPGSAWSPLPSAAQLRQAAAALDPAPRSGGGMSPCPPGGGPSNAWMQMLGQSSVTPSSGASGRVMPGGRMPLLPSPLQRTTQASTMPSPPQAPLPPAPAPPPPMPGVATLGSPESAGGSSLFTRDAAGANAGLHGLSGGGYDSRSGRMEPLAPNSSTAAAVDDSGLFRYVHAVPVASLPPTAVQQHRQQSPLPPRPDTSSGALPMLRPVPAGFAIAHLGGGALPANSTAVSITARPPLPSRATTGGGGLGVGVGGVSAEAPGSAMFNTSNVPASAGGVTTEDPLMLALGSNAGMRRAASMEVVVMGHAPGPGALGVSGASGLATGSQMAAPQVSGPTSTGMRSLQATQTGGAPGPWRDGGNPIHPRLSAGHFTLHSNTSSNPQARLAILAQLGIGGTGGGGGDDGFSVGGGPTVGPSAMPNAPSPYLKNSVLGKLIGTMFRRSRPEDAVRILAQRGLRVRMGMHSGLTDPHAISINKASGRTQYTGEFLTVSKRTSDAANGGQIVLTEETYRQLPARSLLRRAWVLHMGQHHLGDLHSVQAELADEDSEYQLYQVLGYELAVRLALLAPLRTPACLITGVLGAPVGGLVIAFMYVHALQQLMAWNSEVAMEAVELFHRVAAHRCKAHDGYVSESQEGLVLVAFRDAAQALLWALTTQQALLNAPWDPELLEHELAEEVTVVVPVEGLALSERPTGAATAGTGPGGAGTGPGGAGTGPGGGAGSGGGQDVHLHPALMAGAGSVRPPSGTYVNFSAAPHTAAANQPQQPQPQQTASTLIHPDQGQLPLPLQAPVGISDAAVTVPEGPSVTDLSTSRRTPGTMGAVELETTATRTLDNSTHGPPARGSIGTAGGLPAASSGTGVTARGGGGPPLGGGIGAAVAAMLGMYDDDELPPGMVRKVVQRGLRMRVGIDVGRLTESLSPVSSTVVFRGKAMNRAARIGMLATAGQVLCSASAWSGAKASRAVAATERIHAVSMGRHVLRGVAEPIEVFHCRLRAATGGDIIPAKGTASAAATTTAGAAGEAGADVTPPTTAGGGVSPPTGGVAAAAVLAAATASHASSSAGLLPLPHSAAAATAAPVALAAADGLPRLDMVQVERGPGRMGSASGSGRPGTPTAGGRRQHMHYHMLPSPHKQLSMAAAPTAAAAAAAAAGAGAAAAVAASANVDLSRGGSSASAPLAPIILTGMAPSAFGRSSTAEGSGGVGTPTLLGPEAGGSGRGGPFLCSSAASGRQSPSAPLITASLFNRPWDDAGAAAGMEAPGFARTSGLRVTGTDTGVPVSVTLAALPSVAVDRAASAGTDATAEAGTGAATEADAGGGGGGFLLQAHSPGGSGHGTACPPAPWSGMDTSSHAPLSGHLPLPPLPEAEMVLEPYPSPGARASSPNATSVLQVAANAAAAGPHSTGTDQGPPTGGEQGSGLAGISAACPSTAEHQLGPGPGAAPASGRGGGGGGACMLSRAAVSANARAGARLGELHSYSHLDSGDRRSSAQGPGRSVEGRSSAALLTLPSLSQLLGRESGAGGQVTSGARSHVGPEGLGRASPAHSGATQRRSLAGVDIGSGGGGGPGGTHGISGAFASVGRLAAVLSGRFSGPGFPGLEAARGSTGHSGSHLRVGLGLGVGAAASGGDRVRGAGSVARLGGGGGGRHSSTGGDRSSPSGPHGSLAASTLYGSGAGGGGGGGGGGNNSGQVPAQPRGPAGSGGDAPRHTRRRSVLHTRAANVDPASINRALLNSTSVGRRDRVAGLKSGDSRRRLSTPTLEVVMVGTTSPTGLMSQGVRGLGAAQRAYGSQAGAAGSRAGAGRSASGEDTHGDNPTYTTYGDPDGLGGGGGSGGGGGMQRLEADEEPDELGEFEVRDRAMGGGGGLRSEHITILHSRDERERPSRGRRRSVAEDGHGVEGVIARSLHEGRERLSNAAAAIMGFAHLGRTSRQRPATRGVNPIGASGSTDGSRPGSGTVAVVVPTFEDDVRQ